MINHSQQIDFRVLDTSNGSEDRKNMRNYYAAGYLPAFMGHSKYTSRADVINWYVHGIKKPFKTNPVIEAGFAQEIISRDKLELEIGQSLMVCTAARGKYIAAFDGITLDRKIIFEHKLYSQAKIDAMGDTCNYETNPLDFMQIVQQMYVSKAEKCIYMLADDKRDKQARYILTQSDVVDYYQVMIDTWLELDAIKFRHGGQASLTN